MINDKIIENLFVLHFYWHSVQGHVGRKFKPIIFDEYMYEWNLETPNFKIIKSLLIIENEICNEYQPYNFIGNYIKE